MKHLLKTRRALTDFIGVGCELSNPFNIFTAVYVLSGGHPCDECSFNEGCSTIKRFNKEDTRTSSGIFYATNAEIAKKLGVSKRQASKLKRKTIETYS